MQIGFNINGHGSHDLPLDLLPGVLQHVNQTDRLCRCAVVSRKWYHAVNMASTSISCILNTRKDFEGLSAWLCSNNYANKINTVEAQAHKIFSKASVKTKPVLKLPIATLQQLRSLKLSYCSVVVASGGAGDDTNASAAAGTVAAIPELLSLAALTALRGLELEGTVLDLSELSSCTGLQHLALSHVGHLARTATSAANKVIEQAEERSAVGHFPTLIASALYQLTQLTYCSLMYGPYVHSTDRDKLAAEVGAALSNLQQLKELQLGLSWYYASEIAKLPTTLTALHLIGEPKLAWREPMPQLTHFQQLQRLQYGCAECRGAFNLSALTKLTWLDLSNCWFQLDSAVDDLLADIQKLEQLKHLVLSGSLGEEAVPAAGYAALTASKHLTFLDLTNNIFYLDNIEFIFVRENPCVALATLITGSDLFLTPGCFDRLPACCPALQQLEIRDQSGEDPGTFDNHVSADKDTVLAVPTKQAVYLMPSKPKCSGAKLLSRALLTEFSAVLRTQHIIWSPA